ncbi:MAG: HWE histidine kinase domain-containing protein [Hyphomicrobium sp.]
MDSPVEPQFDRITSLVRRFLKVDVCLISLVDIDRQFFKSSSGLGSPWREKRETPLTHSFCQHVVTSQATLIVNDARQDALVCDNEAVKDLNVIAYLGAPIRSSNGEVLGSLCAIKTQSYEWTLDDREALEDFALVVEDEIALGAIADQAKALALENEVVAREYHHRVKNVLSVAGSLLRLSARESTSMTDAVNRTEGRLEALAHAHDVLIAGSEDVDLKILLTRLLAPYQGSGQSAFVIEGPPVALKFKQITPVCLIVHELATNSAKYGAIKTGNPLSVTWMLDMVRIDMTWTEASELVGDPASKPSGFGTRLLDVAAAQLGGTLSIAAASPLSIKIVFPSAAIAGD